MKIPRNDKEMFASSLAETLQAMKCQEEMAYDYMKSLSAHPKGKCEANSELMVWREKICYWTYSVVDHFDLSRRTVAISLNIFDRFLASQGNTCDGAHALLVSLTTLYIAIKAHEQKKIKLCTLVELSRGQFSSTQIEAIEIEILMSLKWMVHPPVPVDFISVFVKFLPPSITVHLRYNIFELSRYLVELAVCDPFLIGTSSSSIAFCAILNVLEDEMGSDIALWSCKQMLHKSQHELNMHDIHRSIERTRERLRSILQSSNQKEPEVPAGVSISAQQSFRPSFSEQLSKDSISSSKVDEKNNSSFLNSTQKDVQDSRHTKNCRSRCNSADSRGSKCSSQGSAAAKWLKSKRKGSIVAPF